MQSAAEPIGNAGIRPEAAVDGRDRRAARPARGVRSDPGSGPAMLTDEQVSILEFERRPWRSAAAKEETALRDLGLTPTRYYARLNALLDSPAALAYDPLLIRRLQRLRDRGIAVRVGREAW